MGNSNTLASIDVGAGYTGMPSFNPTIICLLMAVNTFNGPIIWCLCLFYRLGKISTITEFHGDQPLFASVLKSYGFYRAFELLFITIICTLCRFHIMVWTVFAPKVLYEMALTLMLSLILSLTYAIQKIFVTKENTNKNE